MREKRAVVFETIDLTQEQFDRPILYLLSALLIFMPAAFGAWEMWAEALALAGGCGLAFLLGVKLTRRTDVRFVWSWTYLPIALFFAFIVLQLVPLPAGLVGAMSPRTAVTNRVFLGDLPGAAERLGHLRLSFYEEGTWHDLRDLVTVACVFVVVLNVFRRSEQIVLLLWVIAWIGTAEGLLAILQTFTSAHDVYWMFAQWGDARPDGGSFPNHNAFSQFMNLSSGAMAGLLLLKVDQTFRRHDYTPGEVVEKLGSSEFRSAYLLMGMLAISIGSVFLSLSRGGMLSIAASGVVVGVLLALRGGARGMGIGGWILGVMLVAIFSLVMAGGADLVEGRIARIGNPDDRFDRIELTKDSLRAWRDYPAVGMGLGGFRYTFQPYDRSNVSAVASHAENEYVELLEETGLSGGAIAGVFWLMILGNFLRARARGKKNRDSEVEERREVAVERGGEGSGEISGETAGETAGKTAGKTPGESGRPQRNGGGGISARSHRRRGKQTGSPASSLSLGLCFGLVAILVQSASDFGQHFVSIACLTAISCALLINLASLRRRERGLEAEPTSVRGLRWVRGAIVVVLALVSSCLVWQANTVWAAESKFAVADHLSKQLADNGWRGDPGDFIDMNRAGGEAARLRPNDMRYRFWSAMHQWYTISDVVNPSTGEVVLDASKRKTLMGLIADLQGARWACPLFGPLLAQVGQWEREFFHRDSEGARHIEMAYELAPGDATVCFIVGTKEAEEGKWADSALHFRRAAKLDTGMFSDALNLYVGYFDRPAAALELAGDDVTNLRLVAVRIRAAGKDPAKGPTTGPATRSSEEQVAFEADRRADAIVRAAADRPDAPATVLGEMGLVCSNQGDAKGAINYLGRALKFDYGQVEWRLAYAQNLEEAGRRDEAVHQAEIILRSRPNMPEALDMIERLTKPSKRAIDELAN